MRIVKVEKSGKDSLYNTFLLMTICPLLIFGLIVTVFVSYRVKDVIRQQVFKNLKDIAVSVRSSYDTLDEGDYNILIMEDDKSTTFYKGDTLLSGNTDFIDEIKAVSGIDISLFFADTRMLTTTKDKDSKRYINSLAPEIIVNEVFLQEKEMTYDNVKIGDEPYYAYYMPIYSNDKETCLGMIGTAIDVGTVNAEVNKSIYMCIGILLVFSVITAIIIIRSSSKIMYVIQHILDFLRELTKDNLDVRLNETVSGRKDELGEIGLAIVKLQLSLKKLIQRDGLTGLYNRRAGEKKLDLLEKDGVKSSISIGDIDFFKKFNDNFGHECGDVVLKEVAATLNEGMRGKGFAARWGGEEFLLVFEDMDEVAAGLYLNGILQNIRDKRIEYDGQIHSVTMTFGVVGRKEGERIPDQIRRADEKLYSGKEGGRNRVVM